MRREKISTNLIFIGN